MKLVKLTYEKARPAPMQISVPKGQTVMLAFQVLVNGSALTSDIEVYDDDECLVQSSFNLGDNWHCYEWIASNTDLLTIKDSNSAFSLTIVADESQNSYDVEVENKNPEFQTLTLGDTTIDEEDLSGLLNNDTATQIALLPVVKFGPSWPNDTSVYYNQETAVVTYPGNEVTGLTSMSMYNPTQYARFSSLSGGNDDTCATNFTVDKDILMKDVVQAGYLENQITINGEGQSQFYVYVNEYGILNRKQLKYGYANKLLNVYRFRYEAAGQSFGNNLSAVKKDASGNIVSVYVASADTDYYIGGNTTLSCSFSL